MPTFSGGQKGMFVIRTANNRGAMKVGVHSIASHSTKAVVDADGKAKHRVHPGTGDGIRFPSVGGDRSLHGYCR